MRHLVAFCLLIMWLGGIVISTGKLWWLSIIPVYAWYLVVKMVMHMYGLV